MRSTSPVSSGPQFPLPPKAQQKWARLLPPPPDTFGQIFRRQKYQKLKMASEKQGGSEGSTLGDAMLGDAMLGDAGLGVASAESS
ncbi:Endophilin-A2 [Manis pentadactyla]|nr:Endophilin-A2 [Manis pentadactyla]